ncbi:MAG: PhoU domain-containing protein [Candidatus Hodarchaeota archaeon]
MEIRKVMRLGTTSLVVSVPKEWADKYELDQESRLVLIPQPDGSLALYPQSIPQEKPRTITLTTKPDTAPGLLERQMVAAYLTDYDEILIKSEGVISSDQRNRLRRYLRLLTGYQIMESSTSHLLLLNVARVAEVDMERALYRAHTIAVSMIKDALKSLQNRDPNMARTVIGLEEDVVQFYYLVNKQIRRALLDPNVMSRIHITAIDAVNYAIILHAIHTAAEAAKATANAVLALGDHDCPSDILKLALRNGQFATRLLEDASKAYLTSNDTLANEVINKGGTCPPMRQQAERLMEQHLVKICEEMLPNLTPESCALFGPRQIGLIVLEQVFQSNSQIAVAAATIAERAIWRSLETYRLPSITPQSREKPSPKKRRKSKPKTRSSPKKNSE